MLSFRNRLLVSARISLALKLPLRDLPWVMFFVFTRPEALHFHLVAKESTVQEEQSAALF